MKKTNIFYIIFIYFFFDLFNYKKHKLYIKMRLKQ